jgi:hypothetical protein
MMQKKFILFGTGMSLFLALLLVITSCKKEVEPFELIGPDYSIEKVEYTTNNNELNEFSQVVVKVDVKNAGLMDPTGTYLYVYKDGKYLNEVRVDPMETSEVRTLDFVWDAEIGTHNFELKVDISPENVGYIVENNEDNNTATLELEVALVERQIVNQEDITGDDFEEEVDQEDGAIVDIIDFLEQDNLGTSTTDGQFIKTEYDQEGAINYTMSLHNPDGSIDEDKALSIVTFEAPDGTPVTAPMVTEKGNGDEFFLFDENIRLRVTNGGETVEILEGGFFKDCDEPGMLYYVSLYASLGINVGTDCIADAIANSATYEEYIEAVASCNLAANMAGVFWFAEVDNEPVITVYNNGFVEGCYSCDGTTKQNYLVPKFRAEFEDDRGIETTSASEFNPGCNGGSFTFSVTDCGGNTSIANVVAFQIPTTTEEGSADCHDQGN